MGDGDGEGEHQEVIRDTFKRIGDTLAEEDMPKAMQIVSDLIDLVSAKFKECDDKLKLFDEQLVIMAKDESHPATIILELRENYKDAMQNVVSLGERIVSMSRRIEKDQIKQDTIVAELLSNVEELEKRLAEREGIAFREEHYLVELAAIRKRMDTMARQIEILQRTKTRVVRKVVYNHQKSIAPPPQKPSGIRPKQLETVLSGKTGGAFTEQARKFAKKHLKGHGIDKYQFLDIGLDDPRLLLKGKRYDGLMEIIKALNKENPYPVPPPPPPPPPIPSFKNTCVHCGADMGFRKYQCPICKERQPFKLPDIETSDEKDGGK